MGGPSVTQAGERRSARIESLRAIAALSVVVSHSYLIAGQGWAGGFGDVRNRLVLAGGFGVDLFFVLSGYLLFWPFARAAFVTGEKLDLRRYAVNRALRILPLYYVVIAVLLVLQHGGGSAHQWLRFATFTQNFDNSTLGTVDFPMWSLAVEMEFYLALPLIAWAVIRPARGSLGRSAAGLGVLFAASLALRQTVVWGHTDSGAALWRGSLASLLFFFVLGMGTALARIALERRGRTLPLSASALIATAPLLWLLSAWHYRWELTAGLASVCLLAACVLPARPGRLVSVLDLRPLVGVGVVSYSLYLLHVPIQLAIAGVGLTAGDGRPAPVGQSIATLVLVAVVGVPLCIALAAASYRLVEAPFLRLRRSWFAGPSAAKRPVGPAPRGTSLAPGAVGLSAARTPR